MLNIPKFVKVYRGDETFMGTFEQAVKWLKVRRSVFTSFLKGEQTSTVKLKNVIVNSTTPAFIQKAKNEGKPFIFGTDKETSDNSRFRWRGNHFEVNGIYLNQQHNYVVCLESNDEGAKFTALYIQDNGAFRMADPKNKNCLTVTDTRGKRVNGHKSQCIFPININMMHAKDFNEFLELRNWYMNKIGLPIENGKANLPATQTTVEVEVFKPGVMDFAILQDRVKNLETLFEKFNEVRA